VNAGQLLSVYAGNSQGQQLQNRLKLAHAQAARREMVSADDPSASFSMANALSKKAPKIGSRKLSRARQQRLVDRLAPVQTWD